MDNMVIVTTFRELFAEPRIAKEFYISEPIDAEYAEFGIRAYFPIAKLVAQVFSGPAEEAEHPIAVIWTSNDTATISFAREDSPSRIIKHRSVAAWDIAALREAREKRDREREIRSAEQIAHETAQRLAKFFNYGESPEPQDPFDGDRLDGEPEDHTF